MIEQVTGNLLHADVDALVNTVNTEGVMGKGIALQFRRAYPAMYDAYRAACKAGDVQIGRMMVWETGMAPGTGPRYIINFPTKRHWRSRSRLDDVEAGLGALRDVLRERHIASVAVPPLGAGNGGLPWPQVKSAIIAALSSASDVRILLYEPAGAPDARDMTTARPAKPLTENRAAFIEVLARYLHGLIDVHASLLEVQKLMYFLQAAGQPLRLVYRRGAYGPYADNLRHVLIDTEGTYTIGFGDGTRHAMDAAIDLLPGAEEQAAAVLAGHPETTLRIDHVLALSTGFDSIYGLELLSTVHWLVAEDKVDPSDVDGIMAGIAAWGRRKETLFTRPHVEGALRHLRGLGWV